MDPKNDQTKRDANTEEQPVRHKGEERTREAERKEPLPEGNGATGKPAAFPDHN